MKKGLFVLCGVLFFTGLFGVLSLTGISRAGVFYAPNDVDTVFSLTLVDATDGYTPETEKKFGDTTITYCCITDANSTSAYTDDATTWYEIGDGTGDYKLVIGASEFADPAKEYFVKIVVSGCRTVTFRVQTPGDIADRFNNIGSMSESTMSDEMVSILDTQGYTSTRAGYIDNINKTLPTIGDVNTALDTKLPADFNSVTATAITNLTEVFDANWATVWDPNTDMFNVNLENIGSEDYNDVLASEASIASATNDAVVAGALQSSVNDILSDTGTTLPALIGTPIDTDLVTDVNNLVAKIGTPKDTDLVTDVNNLAVLVGIPIDTDLVTDVNNISTNVLNETVADNPTEGTMAWYLRLLKAIFGSM